MLGALFGSMSKAGFAKYGPEEQKRKATPDLKPVYLNPSDITVSYKTNSETKSSTGEPKKEESVQPGDTVSKLLKMTFYIDLLSQYEELLNKANAKKGREFAKNAINAALGSASFKEFTGKASGAVAGLMAENDLSKFSVLSESVSVLPLLQDCFIDSLVVIFQWGPMVEAGMLSELSSQFTYFSKQGAPLRAQVTLTLECYPRTEEFLAGLAEKTHKANVAKLTADGTRPRAQA